MPARTPTVLVVDDESGIIQLIELSLKQEGFRTVSAVNCENALLACCNLKMANSRDARIDLLLCDVVLPDSSGPDLARQVVNLYPECRVVFMSGWDDISDRYRLPTGATFIRKPFKLVEVTALIQAALLPRAIPEDQAIHSVI